MKYKKKVQKRAFTLIELLAVIAILAAILLIAVPKILDILDNVKIKSFKESAQLIVGIAEKNYARDIIDAESGFQEYYYKDSVEYSAGLKELKYSGKKPENGVIYVTKTGKISAALHDGEYCAVKTTESPEFVVTEIPLEECNTDVTINTADTWAEIALEYGVPLDVLLDYNEADESTPTDGLDIKIPIFIKELSSDACGFVDNKVFYTMGYVEVGEPFTETVVNFSVTLGNLPLEVGEITKTTIEVSDIMKNDEDFERYVVKKLMGDITYETDASYYDFTSPETFSNHALTNLNMSLDSVTVTCGATCVADISMTVSDVNGVSTTNVNAKDIVYIPVKFIVNFNDYVPDGYDPICKIEELYAIRDDLNSNYVILNDLDFENDASYTNATASTVDYNGDGTTETIKEEFTTDPGWLPINNFAGTLDGNGNDIINLYINRQTTNYIGFFGEVHPNSDSKEVIKNLGIISSYVAGRQDVGGFVGFSVSGKYSNLHYDGMIYGTYQNTGGIIGNLDDYSTYGGLIENSYSTGRVYGSDHETGGIVGKLRYGLIDKCYSTSDVDSGDDYVGGIAGYIWEADITNCISASDITGGISGGIYGHIWSTTTSSNNYRLDTVTPFWGSGTTTSKDGQPETITNLQSGDFLLNTMTWDTTTIWQVNASAWPTLR